MNDTKVIKFLEELRDDLIQKANKIILDHRDDEHYDIFGSPDEDRMRIEIRLIDRLLEKIRAGEHLFERCE